MEFARFLLATAILAVANIAWAEVLVGQIVGVADGDTVTLLDEERRQHRIRLAGIDAPEKAQPFGQRAKQKLSELVYYRDVAVEWSKVDNNLFQRKVGKVMLRPDYCPGAGCPYVRDANLEMLTSGLTWHYKKYEGEQSKEDRERYAAAEEEARARKAGLWRDPAPEAPWDYRKREKAERLRKGK